MAKKNANARSKRVAKKKKVANRLKNELRRVDSVKSNPTQKSSGEVIELFLEDKDHFFKAYFTMLSKVNDLSKGEIDAYPFEVQALFTKKKPDIAKRYLRVYNEMMLHEYRQKDMHKKTFIRNTESLVYDIMWLDVCSDDRELLGPTGYDTLKSQVNNQITDFLDVLRNNVVYLNYAKSGVFVPKIVFEWITKTTGIDFSGLMKVA